MPFSDRRGLRRYGSFFDVVRLYRALARERPDIILQFVGSAHTGIAALYARQPRLQDDLARHERSQRRAGERAVAPRPPASRAAVPELRHSQRHADPRANASTSGRGWPRAFPHAPVQVLPNFHPTAPDCGRNGAVVKQVAWIANLKPLKNPGAFMRLARRFAHRSDIHFVMIGDTMDDGDLDEASSSRKSPRRRTSSIAAL